MNENHQITGNEHHLILGEIEDFITGKTIADTYDERHKQKISRMLVKLKQFEKTDIESKKQVIVQAGEKKAVIKADFLVYANQKAGMLIKYGPGSIVTRRKSGSAFAKIIKPYLIPVTVITNGEDAEIIDSAKGAVYDTGFENIPDKNRLSDIVKQTGFPILSKEQFEMASRIVFAFEVDDSCPCDSDICKIE